MNIKSWNNCLHADFHYVRFWPVYLPMTPHILDNFQNVGKIGVAPDRQHFRSTKVFPYGNKRMSWLPQTNSIWVKKHNFFNMILKSASARRSFQLVFFEGWGGRVGQYIPFTARNCLVKITFIAIVEDPRNNPMILLDNSINR